MLRSGFAQRALAVLVWGYLLLVRYTTRWEWRYEQVTPDELSERYGNVVVAFWHSRLLMMPPFSHRLKAPMCVMISHHRDGAFITSVCKLFGVRAVRGSSRRGGVGALKGAQTVLAEGANLGITPDGPRGPVEQVQLGVISLAKKSGRPIIPVAYGVKRGKRINSWDRFLVPYPFTRGCFAIGAPMHIAPDDDDQEQAERLRLKLQHMTALADAVPLEGR